METNAEVHYKYEKLLGQGDITENPALSAPAQPEPKKKKAGKRKAKKKQDKKKQEKKKQGKKKQEKKEEKKDDEPPEQPAQDDDEYSNETEEESEDYDDSSREWAAVEKKLAVKLRRKQDADSMSIVFLMRFVFVVQKLNNIFYLIVVAQERN